MDVKTATQATANTPIASLNTKKASDSPIGKRWGDTLNAALDGQGRVVPQGAGVNTTMLSDAQKSRQATGVNGAKKLRHGVTGMNDAITRSSTSTTKPTTQPVDAALNDKIVESKSDAAMRQTAQTLVNQFFMGTMLKQMRDSPFKSDLFNGGKAGDAYAGMFDQRVAEHAGNRIARNLVESMVKQYQRSSPSKVKRNDASIALSA